MNDKQHKATREELRQTIKELRGFRRDLRRRRSYVLRPGIVLHRIEYLLDQAKQFQRKALELASALRSDTQEIEHLNKRIDGYTVAIEILKAAKGLTHRQIKAVKQAAERYAER